jgi:hypothetical protein
MNVGLTVTFVLCVVATAAFWGVRLYGGPQVERPTMAGAPSNAIAMPPSANGVTMLRSADGKPFTADEVRAFVQQETAKGNGVREVSPGVLVVVPPSAAPARGGAK